MSKNQEEWEKLKRHGIRFVGELAVSAWPEHLKKTFRQIHDIGSCDTTRFCEDAQKNLKLGIAWDYETVIQANRIVSTCKSLQNDNVTEMEWRLRMEELCLARFTSNIKCRCCKRRVWRSNKEAIVEWLGTVATEVDARRKDREQCECANKLETLMLPDTEVKIFSSRSDEKVRSKLFEEMPVSRNRKPDRVIGFREMGSVYRKLASINNPIQNKAAVKPGWKEIEYSILETKSRPLLFPFMIVEAKSGEGNGFETCRMQTAIPIFEMLNLQAKLQAEFQAKLRRQPEEKLQYGGPLVWFFAYRGEHWHLYACYTDEMAGQAQYIIAQLWSGLLHKKHDALQLLLMVDYIFDWARDIYRQSIIDQLRALETKLLEEFGSKIVRVKTGSDTSSLAKSRPILGLDTSGQIVDTENLSDSPREISSTDCSNYLSRTLDGIDAVLCLEQISPVSGSCINPTMFNLPGGRTADSEGIVPFQRSGEKQTFDSTSSPSNKSLDSDSLQDEVTERISSTTNSITTICQEFATEDQFTMPSDNSIRTIDDSPLGKRNYANKKICRNSFVAQTPPPSRNGTPGIINSCYRREEALSVLNVHNINTNTSQHKLWTRSNRTSKAISDQYLRSPPDDFPPPSHDMLAARTSRKHPLVVDDDESGIGSTALNLGKRIFKRPKKTRDGA